MRQLHFDNLILRKADQLAKEIEFETLYQVQQYGELAELIQKNYPKAGCFSTYYLSPQTKVFLLRHAGKLVASLSLVHSGALALPIENLLSIPTRKSSHRYAEITDFSVDPDFGQPMEAKLLLLREALRQLLALQDLQRIYLCEFQELMADLPVHLGFSHLTKNFPIHHLMRQENCHYFFASPLSLQNKWMYPANQEQRELYQFLEQVTPPHWQNSDFRLFHASHHSTVMADCFAFINQAQPDLIQSLSPADIRSLRNNYLGQNQILQLLPDCDLPSGRKEVRHQVWCDAVELDHNSQPLGQDLLQIVSVARKGLAFRHAHTNYKKGSVVRLRVELGRNILSDLEIKIASSYNGMISAQILRKDHYWNRFHQYLEKKALTEN